MADQHASLTAERWSEFSLDQQILMIGNEMNRAAKLLAPADRERLRSCYERVLRLTDLTVATRPGPGLRRELLRWRELVAALYVSPDPSPVEHRAAFRCLLQFTPVAAAQIAYML
jgi:hypothetical protein